MILVRRRVVQNVVTVLNVVVNARNCRYSTDTVERV